MIKAEPHTVLITGATDGIGLELARIYQAQNKRLILIGRRPLSELSDPLFTPENYCQADLRTPDCAVFVRQFLFDHEISWLHLLIHNAGVGYYGNTAEQSPESIDTLWLVNLVAPLGLTHKLLSFMTPHDLQSVPPPINKRPKIVFISSMVSAVPCPNYAVYGATKAALDGFARNLRVEMQNFVEVQLIHPGATRTGLHAKSGMPREVADWHTFPTAEKVARQISFSIKSEQQQVTIGLKNRLIQTMAYYFSGLVEWVMRRQHQRR